MPNLDSQIFDQSNNQVILYLQWQPLQYGTEKLAFINIWDIL